MCTTVLKPRSQIFNVHTEKNVFGAITYFGRRHVIHKGRASRVNHYNLSGEFALHNPAERALVHGSQPELVSDRTKNAVIRKCTTDLSCGFSPSDSRNTSGEVQLPS